MLETLRPSIALKVGSYNSTTGQWTDGGTSYSANLDGTTIKVTGTIPKEDADATLGLAAGNRLSLRISNSDITSKSDLPAGDIVTVIGDTVTNTYTKDAFESDGSLIYVGNVSKNSVTLKITWTAGNETVYTVDLSTVILAQ